MTLSHRMSDETVAVDPNDTDSDGKVKPKLNQHSFAEILF